MSLFCLVHGSTQNASGWARLVPELEKRGHRAISVNLPTDEPEASGTRYAQVIAEALRDSTEAPIVVAHSSTLASDHQVWVRERLPKIINETAKIRNGCAHSTSAAKSKAIELAEYFSAERVFENLNAIQQSVGLGRSNV